MNDHTSTQKTYVFPDLTKNIVVESTPQADKNYLQERYSKMLGVDIGNKDEAKVSIMKARRYGMTQLMNAHNDHKDAFSFAIKATEKDIADDPGLGDIPRSWPQVKLRRYAELKPPKFLKDKLTLKFKDGKWI